MCGVVAVVRELAADEGDARLAARMLETMPHRGPDARGVHRSGRVTLGHLRLSIVDLSPESNQPFVDAETGVALSYNGEIFNYVELREELVALGHRFRTSSDTEVALRSYLQWGLDAFVKWNGMWALVLHDPRTDRVVLCRDRFGVKPLYWAKGAGALLVASEIKAILRADPALAEPNHELLGAMLRRSAGVTSRETFFARVHAVEPAHHLVIDGPNEAREQRWWSYEGHGAPPPDERAAVDVFRDLLLDAVRLRMRSDVPVGLTLSGGLDSSSILALVHRRLGFEIDAYTATFGGAAVDEGRDAASLSAELGARWRGVETPVRAFGDLLAKAVWHMDAPTHCPAVVPLLELMRAIRGAGTVVVLEGQGADELLGGYEDANFPQVLAETVRADGPLAALRGVSQQARGWGLSPALAWSARAAYPPVADFWRWFRGDERVYRGPIAGQAASGGTPQHSPATLGPWLHAQHTGMLRSLLHYGDAISMAASIESRFPFLDHRLVELGFALPTLWKARLGEGKRILRRAMAADLPPRLLVPRRKLGFDTPYSAWIDTHEHAVVRPVLLDARTAARGLFDAAAMERAIRQHRGGRRGLAAAIFRWMAVELWFRQAIDRPGEPAISFGP